MDVQLSLPGTIPTVEALPTAQMQTVVLRLVSLADRARALGRREEADTVLLQAWAALDR